MKNIKKYALVAALALGLTACSSSTDNGSGSSVSSNDSAAEQTQVLTAEAEGYSSTIKVSVTKTGDKIEKIERESEDTDKIGEIAMDELTKEIVDKNSVDVEDVSGATVSSQAFKKAVQEALDSADAN